MLSLSVTLPRFCCAPLFHRSTFMEQKTDWAVVENLRANLGTRQATWSRSPVSCWTPLWIAAGNDPIIDNKLQTIFPQLTELSVVRGPGPFWCNKIYIWSVVEGVTVFLSIYSVGIWGNGFVIFPEFKAPERFTGSCCFEQFDEIFLTSYTLQEQDTIMDWVICLR